jgi:hypothetical protein
VLNFDKSDEAQNLIGDFDKEYTSFIKEFQRSGAHTIDSFIARHPKYKELAKLLVGYILAEKAFHSRRIVDGAFESNDGSSKPWIYSYLNKRVGTNYTDFIKMPDCFITFNYDLSLEEHFINFFESQSLDNSVYLNAKRIVKQELPIFHVYGSISNLEYILNKFDKREIPTTDDMLQMSDGITFIERKK